MSYDELPTTSQAHDFSSLPSDKARTIDEVCDCFEHQLYTCNGPAIESLVAGFGEPECSILLRELLWLEFQSYLSRDTRPNREKYFHRFPNHVRIVQQVCDELFPQVSEYAEPDRAVEPPPNIPNYRILAELGRGGMGVVYQAMHTGLGNLVAIKVLAPSLARDYAAEVRFKREMRAVGTLNDVHIVQARDAGTAEGVPYLVMEYIVGVDLSKLVERLGPLRVADACEITRRIALALECARQNHLVHRDIKPQNVLFGHHYGATESAQVKVTDFGLALLRGYPRPSDAGVSREIVGTVTYMAPEQYWEQTSDIRSDLYSLGCTLYYLLTSRPPFSRVEYPSTVQLMTAHQLDPVPPLRKLRPDVSEPLEWLILAMLAKDPDDRPTIPRDVARQLEQFTDGHDLDRLLSDVTDAAKESDMLDAAHSSVAFVPAWPDHAESFEARGDAAPRPTESFMPVQDDSGTRPWASPTLPPAAVRREPPNEPPEAGDESVRPPPPLDCSIIETDRSPRASRRTVLMAIGVMMAIGVVAMVGLLALGVPRDHRPATVDLLKEVDLDRDVIAGQWQLQGSVLVSPDERHAQLALPCLVPSAYRLDVEARKKSGGRLVIGLVRDGRQIPIVLDDAMVAGTPAVDQSATELARRAEQLGFTGGAANTYTCLVKPTGLLVAFEDQIHLLLEPEDKLPETEQEWRVPGADGLFIGTHHSIYHFHRLTLTPIQP